MLGDGTAFENPSKNWGLKPTMVERPVYWGDDDDVVCDHRECRERITSVDPSFYGKVVIADGAAEFENPHMREPEFVVHVYMQMSLAEGLPSGPLRRYLGSSPSLNLPADGTSLLPTHPASASA